MEILNCLSLILITLIMFIVFIVKKTSNHADNKHGETAEQIRTAIKEKGYFEIWQEKLNKNVYHHLVKLNDGKIGDWVIVIKNGIKIEKSVFIPKDGSLSKIHIWLNKKAIQIKE